MRKSMNIMFGAMLAMAVAPAAAQSAVPEGYTEIPVEFSGTVTSSITEAVMIRNPDGSFSPYSGPVPDYPFDVGDPITIGFTAIVPTGESIAAGIVPESADGIYSFQIGPRPEQLADFPGTASYTDLQGNGGIAGTGGFSTDGGLNIIYDANTDSYLIDPSEVFRTGDSFGIGFFDVPVLAYDAADGSLSVAQYLDFFDNSTLAWSGTGDTTGRLLAPVLNFNGVDYLGTSNSPTGPQDIVFSGSWNLPLFGSSSGPTPVPAPPMMVLFGLAALAVLRRKIALRAG